MTLHNPRNFVRHVADIPTEDGHLIFGAQFHVDETGAEHRLVLIGNEAVDLVQLPAIYAALGQAARTLEAA